MESPKRKYVIQEVNPTRSSKKKDDEEYLRFVRGLVNDVSLKDAIAKRTKELGIDETLFSKRELLYDKHDGEPLARDYLLELMQLSGKRKTDSVKALNDAINDIMLEEKIDNIFRWLIYYMMARPEEGDVLKMIKLYKREYNLYKTHLSIAEIEKIDDGDITIKVDRKVNKKQFMMIWGAIEEYCRDYPVKRFLRQRLIFLHDEKGYGYGTLAKIYYPEKQEEVNGERSGIDIVRAIIKRGK